MTVKPLARVALTVLAATYLLVRSALRCHTPRIVMSTYTFFGHVALEPEKRLLGLRVDGDSRREWWSFGSRREQPNRFLVDVWSRAVQTPPSWWIAALIRAGEWLPRFAPEVVNGSLFDGRNLIDRLPMQLPVRRDEQARFAREMLQLNIDVEKPFAVLTVRDPAYFGHLARPLSDGSVRDRDIDDFAPAVDALVDAGIQVVRLGHRVAKPLAVSRDGVLDYATSGHRSEFLDVYLPVRATFGISTLTGPDALCIVGRRPVLYVDVAVYAQPFHETELTWWTPARLTVVGSTQPVSLGEAFRRGWGWFEGGAEFRDHDVSVARSTPEEIRADVIRFASECRQLTPPHQRVADIRELLAREMGARGVAMHGRIRSSVPSSFIDRHTAMFTSV